VMIKEEPAIKLCFTQRSLNAIEFHKARQ
jgi:hypothetical protein